MGKEIQAGGKYVSINAFENEVIRFCRHALGSLNTYGISPPLFAFLTFVDVSGYELNYDPYLRRRAGTPVRQDVLMIPEIEISDLSMAPDQVLRPLFDMAWNGFGFPRSFSYDENGRYDPH